MTGYTLWEPSARDSVRTIPSIATIRAPIAGNRARRCLPHGAREPPRRWPRARTPLGGGAIDGIFSAVGGRDATLFATLEAYDPGTNSWRTDLAPMPTARGGLAVAALRGRLLAIGGEGNPNDPLGIFPQTEAYDPATDTWESLPPMRTPRHGIGAAALRARIFVPGGATIQGFGADDANEALWP
jgi:hypothetical protein